MKAIQFGAVFVVGLIVGAAFAIVQMGPKQYAKGLEQGRHEIRLEAIQAEAGTMRGGRFVWTPAK